MRDMKKGMEELGVRGSTGGDKGDGVRRYIMSSRGEER